jgi:hypothetical protein
MPSLLELLKDPNYTNANEATKLAIFNKYSALDANFINANGDTQNAIKQRFGVFGGPAAPEKAPTAPTTLRDVGVAGASGVVGAAKSMTDFFGADNAASKTLGDASTSLQGMYTPERQKEMQYYQQLQEKAAKSGDTMGEIGAAFQGIKAAPLQGTVQAIGSLIPNLATLLIPGAGQARALQISRGAINTALGIVQGTGAVKGALYEGIKQELVKNGMDEASAAKQAGEAQSYLGPNTDQILLGAGIGLATGKLGAEELLSPAIKGAARKAIAVGAEAGTEAIQGGQEQVAQNLGLTRAGMETPMFQGVAGAATQEGILGALGAGPVTLLGNRPSQKDVPDAPPVNDQQIPLLLEDKGVFRPVGLPDGSVAMTREDLASYEAEQFRKKYAPQDIEREKLMLGYEPFTPKVTPAGTVAMSPEDVSRAEESDFRNRYEPKLFEGEELEQRRLQQKAEEPFTGELISGKPRKLTEEEVQENKEREAEIKSLTKEARLIEKDIKSYKGGKRAGQSLRPLLEGALTTSEVIDIDPKFTWMNKAEGGTSISTLVENGQLNRWLPSGLRTTSETFDPQEATEKIKEKIRNRDWKEVDSQLTAAELGRQYEYLTERIDELKRPKKAEEELSGLTLEERRAEADRLAVEAGYLGQPRGEEVLKPIEEPVAPVEDEYYPDKDESPAPVTEPRQPMQLPTMPSLPSFPEYLQGIPSEPTSTMPDVGQPAGLPAVLPAGKQTPDVPFPVPPTAPLTPQAQAATQDFGVPAVVEPKPQEAPAPEKRKPSTALTTETTDIIEGQMRVIDDETIQPQVMMLSAPEQQVLADHYGEEVDSPAFLAKVREDIYKFATKGAQAVSDVIRDIIRKLHAVLLATTIILNPSAMGPSYQVALPQNVTTVEQVLAKVPDAVKNKMSPGAQQAYANIMPAFGADLQKNNKLFIITDKPNARIFVFDSKGQPILDKKVLLGLQTGDYYKGDPEKIKANRITPAGLYTMGLRDGKRGVTETGGDETATTAGYDFNKVFVLDKAAPDGSYSVTLFHSVYAKMSDAKRRLAALDKEGAEDSRYSFGCINVDKDTYKNLLDKYESQMDGAKLFIVPDNPDATMDFLRGKAVTAGDLSRQATPEVTKTVTKTVPGTPSAAKTSTQLSARKEEDQDTRRGLYMEAKRGEKGMSKADVDVAVDRIKSTWKNAPDIEVVQSISELPEEIQADIARDKVNPRGVYDPDTKKVWLVADNIPNDAQAAITLAHESFGHFGLRVALGANFKPMMNSIYEGNKDVKSRADAYINDGMDKVTAVEEVLSEMAQEVYDTRVPENKNKLSALQKVMNAIRQFLARIGVPMKSISDAQVLALIANARRSVVRGGKYVNMEGGKALYSEGMSSNFRKWFGKSKVVDKNGKPLVMYHGTYSDISEPTTNFGADEYRRFGMHVGSLEAATNRLDIKAAEDTAQGEKSGNAGANVLPVYVKAEKPLRLDENRSGRWGVDDIMRSIFEKAERGEIDGLTDEDIDNWYSDNFDLETWLGLEPDIGEDNYDSEREERLWSDTESYFPGERSKLLSSFINQLGYDSIVYKNEFEGGGDSYILLKPTQVKSVFNKGEFNPEDKRILYSVKDRAAQVAAKARNAAHKAGQKRRMDEGLLSDLPEHLQAKARKTFTPENETIVTKIDGLQDKFWQKMAQGIVDQYRTIKDYTKEGYMLARMSKTIDGALEGMLFHGQVFLNGGALDIKSGTKGLLQIMAPLGKDVDRYQMWVALNREADIAKKSQAAQQDIDQAEADIARMRTMKGNAGKAFDKETKNILDNKDLSAAKKRDALSSLRRQLDKYKNDVDKAINAKRKEIAGFKNRIKAPSIDAELVAERDKFAEGMIDGRAKIDVYREVQREMNKLNRSVLNVALEQGLINKEAYDIFASDINYIPFYKMMEDGDLQGASTASGLGSQYFSRALEGGEKPFGDLMENTLRNWSHILSASMKNKAAAKTLEAASELEGARPNLKVGLEWVDNKVYSTKTGAMVDDGSLKPEYTTSEGTGIIKVMIDGQPTYYKVLDDLLLDSVASIGYMGPKSKFLDVARDFKNILQYGVTLSPGFKVRNLFRDSIQAMAVSGLKLTPWANVVEGWAKSDRNNPAHISALAGGAIFNFGSAYEGDQSRMVKKLIKMGIAQDSILDSDNKIKAGLMKAWSAYTDLGNKSESANRMSLYQQMIDKGMSHLEASFHARDLMDFSMQGSFPALRMVTQVVPFLNARLQGLYKLGRDGIIPTSRVIYNSTTGKPIDASDKMKAQQFSIVTGAVMMASMMLYLAFKDDEEFKKREDWDRDNFWWFRLPGMETAIRVPKPFEIGAFGTMAERLLEQMIDQGAEGKQFEDSIKRMLSDTFAMNPTPQLIKPMIDLYANKDSFTGAPIETAGMERLSKAERASDNTSPLAIALSGIQRFVSPKAMEMSPVQVDYAIKSYFGWLGGTVAATSHYAVMPFSKSAYPDHNWTETMSMGFIKSLPATQSKYVTAFYENNKQISQAYADMRHYAEIGDQDMVAKILEEKGDLIGLQKFYDRGAKDMAKIRQAITAIRNDATMGGDQKKEEIDRLKIIIGQVAEQLESVRKSVKQ